MVREGVDGSSPPEGSAKSAGKRRFFVQVDLLGVESALRDGDDDL